jgi:hypothetical protein
MDNVCVEGLHRNRLNAAEIVANMLCPDEIRGPEWYRIRKSGADLLRIVEGELRETSNDLLNDGGEQ